MNTPCDQPHLSLLDTDTDTDTEPAGLPRWRRALTGLGAFCRDNPAAVFIADNWLLATIALIVLAVTGAMLWASWLLISAAGDAIGGAGHAASGALLRLGRWLAHGPITHTINDPVRAFLNAHTAGLPATGRDLWIVWLITCAVLYAGALAGSRYARIGWAVIGVLTAAAGYAGATAGAGPGAAGLSAAVWLLLSLPAYARPKRYSLLEQLALDLQSWRRLRESRTELDHAIARAQTRPADTQEA